MACVEVEAACGRRQVAAFIECPYDLHRGDPYWVPALRRDVRELLSRPRNPFFQHAEAEYFLARRAGRVVGRVAAVHNRRHDEAHGERLAFFGFFECADDPGAARALLDAVALWGRGRGLQALRGPVSFSTNDECGLLVEGFDTPPALLTPYNPPRYAELITAAGFQPVKDLLAYRAAAAAPPARLAQGVDRLQRRHGLCVRALDPRRFRDEVALVKHLYNAAWEHNWGFVPLTDAEIDHVAGRLRPLLVPDLAAFVEHQGRPVGFALALPDFNVALKANPGGRLVPGLLRVLLAARRIDRVRVLMLGTLPEWRRRGVDGLLCRHLWERAWARGYHWAEAGWVLEDNRVMRNTLERLGFEAYKRYRLYERAL